MADIDLDAAVEGGSEVAASLTASSALHCALSGGSTALGSALVITGPPAWLSSSQAPRIVPPARLVLDQVDWWLADGITRAQEVGVSDLLIRMYLDGDQLNWPLVSGVGVTTPRIAAGKVYFTEFSAGFYNIRWFPNAVGNWRILLTWAAGGQARSLTYDVQVPASAPSGVGLRSSFFRK